ncbi:MAG TPA: RecX family transcriptional regulator [Humisphaera sp.]|jgi:regulatory protein|nr:RecX family transcriptional regulator [Humisphaera sp.]
MPSITQISHPEQRPTIVNVFVDGKRAFSCSTAVAARFRLRVGMELDEAQFDQIKRGQEKQTCFDAAMNALNRRMHSRVELQRKLGQKKKFSPEQIVETLDKLAELGYLNDERYAAARAQSLLQHKHHGRRRAMAELRRRGVAQSVANQALDAVYDPSDSLAAARKLAEKQAARLRKLDPQTARRRLAAMLQRRGFEYEAVKTVIDETLGGRDE